MALRIRTHIVYPAAVKPTPEPKPKPRVRGDCRAWTDDQDQALTALYATTSAAKVAIRMGRTENAIKSRAVLLGLVKREDSLQRRNQSRVIGIQRQFGYVGA